MSRTILRPCLVFGLALLCTPFAGASSGKVSTGSEGPWPPASSGGTLTGSYSNPELGALSFTLTGADLTLKPGTLGSYEGTSTGSTITINGHYSFTLNKGYVSWIAIDAKIGEQAYHWPSTGPTERVDGPRTVSENFNVAFKIGSSKVWTKNVVASINIRVCGGICSGYAIDAVITFKKPSSPPAKPPSPPAKPPLQNDRPLALAWEVKQPYPLRPGTYAWLPYSLRDDSGKAKLHATLYEGGEAVFEWASKYFLTADGRHQNWKVHLSTSLKGPLYFCVWAENPKGAKSLNAPKSDCAFLSFLVDIKRVSNGCGGEGWDSLVWVENYFGNVHTYYDPGTGATYRVSFVDACDLHDAGYAGMTVEDKINGGPPKDMHGWTRKVVDDEFWRNMKKLCDKQIPPSATVALAKCKGVGGRASIGSEWLYNKVRDWGGHFFDADLETPGTQKHGSRANS
jgi:hypothetical protein